MVPEDEAVVPEEAVNPAQEEVELAVHKPSDLEEIDPSTIEAATEGPGKACVSFILVTCHLPLPLSCQKSVGNYQG